MNALKRMQVEAITVCVGYGDFLDAVAPQNLPHFHRWIVVTHPTDDKTRAVCRKYSIECQLSEEMYTHGTGPFNKARAINKAIQQCKGDDWILHIDADIALPIDFHQCVLDAHLHPDSIYGATRLNVMCEDNWELVKREGLISRKDTWVTNMQRNGCTIGGNVAKLGMGYSPIGFFQLWAGHHSLQWVYPGRVYPEGHGNASRTDTQFALQWDRRNRILIPELIVFHLESEAAEVGANWNGRKTRLFQGSRAGSAGIKLGSAAPQKCY